MTAETNTAAAPAATAPTPAQIAEQEAATLAAALLNATSDPKAMAAIATDLKAADTASKTRGYNEALKAARRFPLSYDLIRHWRVRRGNATGDIGPIEKAVRDIQNTHRPQSGPAYRDTLSELLQCTVNSLDVGAFPSDMREKNKRIPKISLGEKGAHKDQPHAYQAFQAATDQLPDENARKAWQDAMAQARLNSNLEPIRTAVSEATAELGRAIQDARRFRSMLILPLIAGQIEGICAGSNGKISEGSVWQKASEAAYGAIADKVSKAIEDNKGVPPSEEFCRNAMETAVNDALGINPKDEESPEARRKRLTKKVFGALIQLHNDGGLSKEAHDAVIALLKEHGVEDAKAAPPATASAQAQAAILQDNASQAAPEPAPEPAPVTTGADSAAAANVVANMTGEVAPAPAPAPEVSPTDKLAAIRKNKAGKPA